MDMLRRKTRPAFSTGLTTLLDEEEYPPEEIALLFRQRWQVELNLRSLKTVMQMDHLRCKTPHLVRNNSQGMHECHSERRAVPMVLACRILMPAPGASKGEPILSDYR